MKVGVIGAGTMGSGIAQVFAQTDGYTVALCDMTSELAQAGYEKIRKNLSKQVTKGKITQERMDEVLGRVSYGHENFLCADCDLIVEAVSERMTLKKDLFRNLDSLVKDDCIFTSNTSSLSITEIGNGIRHPMLGMHFFNPAPVMKLIEVIAGINTPPEVVERVVEIAKEIGKCPVEVNESAGFVVNRILVPQINEAAFILQEGVASISAIDSAMKLGANVPMGPLELGDYIGLDVIVAIMDVMYTETSDSKYRCCPLLRKMVRGNLLGCKTGKGFYDYANGGKVPTDAQ